MVRVGVVNSTDRLKIVYNYLTTFLNIFRLVNLRYHFDWNPNKEKQNIRKHQVNFRVASTIFRDPYQ